MAPRISAGDCVKDLAIAMRILVVGDHVQHGETHRLVLQHVNARSKGGRQKTRESMNMCKMKRNV